MGVQGTDNTVIGFPFFHRVEPLFDFQIKRISDLVFYYIFLLLLCTALLENLGNCFCGNANTAAINREPE